MLTELNLRDFDSLIDKCRSNLQRQVHACGNGIVQHVVYLHLMWLMPCCMTVLLYCCMYCYYFILFFTFYIFKIIFYVFIVLWIKLDWFKTAYTWYWKYQYCQLVSHSISLLLLHVSYVLHSNACNSESKVNTDGRGFCCHCAIWRKTTGKLENEKYSILQKENKIVGCLQWSLKK